MWLDFSDVELIRLAYDYCLDDILEREGNKLLNRSEVELALRDYEHNYAFA
jgi:hypothetical protein